MSKTTLRANAHKLLAATKSALAYFIATGAPENEMHARRRTEVMGVLREALDAAEGDEWDESLASVELVMTPNTAKELLKDVRDRDDGSDEHERLLEVLTTKVRRTKKRVYIRLPIDHPLLRCFKYILDTTANKTQKNPYQRFAKQIEKEGLSVNPMEILAQMGL